MQWLVEESQSRQWPVAGKTFQWSPADVIAGVRCESEDSDRP